MKKETPDNLAGTLYVVPTPIGNLEDITLRAIRVLKECDLLLCEDTRQTQKLLNHYEIQNKVSSYHLHNEHKVTERFIKLLREGKSLALVSDAGTPGISDPGFLLVRSCVENDIPINCLPGPTSFVPALILSGYPFDRFIFEGFLPTKKGRTKKLESLKEERRTIIFFESPHRILRTLKDLANFFGEERQISVSKELTKIYENTTRGAIKDVITIFEKIEKIKGEFVLILKSS